jgi:hypothetical protein
VRITDPKWAQRKLEELSAARWRWMVLPHNCASYVEEILTAGGAKDAGIASNCPVEWKYR